MRTDAAKKAWETRRNNQGHQVVPPEIVEADDGKIKLKELLSILKLCNKFVAKQEFVRESYKCFKFEGDKIKACTKDKGIVYDTKYDLGCFYVNAAELIKTLHLFHDKDFIDVEFKNDVMIIESGGLKAQVRIAEYDFDDPDDFPKVPDEFKTLPSSIFESVDRVAWAATNDRVSFDKIAGIFVDKNIFYATNNLVIAKYVSDLVNDETFVIPVDLLKSIDKHSILKAYSVDDKNFWFRFDSYVVFVSRNEKAIDFSLLRERFDEFPKDLPVRKVGDMNLEFLTSSKEVKFEDNLFSYENLSNCTRRSKEFMIIKDKRTVLRFQEENLDMLLISMVG